MCVVGWGGVEMRSAITKYYGLDGLNNTYVLLTVLEARKSNIKALAIHCLVSNCFLVDR